MDRSAGSCIDENVIGALFEHRLSTAEIEAIDDHVAGCTECRDLLCDLARADSPKAPVPSRMETAAIRALRETLRVPAAAKGMGDTSLRRVLALFGCEQQLGQVLADTWRIEALLGVGGMAEVYAASHITNGRRVAIKMLRREWVAKPNTVRRFMREGRVANRIRHPGAVAVIDEGTSADSRPFIVLELLEGQTLGRHVEDRLPIATVLWIASEVLDVLAAAHELQVIHRDIKPENVFLTRDGSVKLLDFGIARVREVAATNAGNFFATQQGTLMGTPAYIPPEQASGRLSEIDARTDVWAVGATMFALLAGRSVHGRGTSEEMLASARKNPVPKVSSVANGVPPEVGAIVDRALAFARDDRWQNAREMQAAIRDVLRRMQATPSSAWIPTNTVAMAERQVAPLAFSRASSERPPKPTSSRGVLAFAAVLTLALLSAGIFVVRVRAHRSTAQAPLGVVATPTATPTQAPPESSAQQAKPDETKPAAASPKPEETKPMSASSSPKPRSKAPRRTAPPPARRAVVAAEAIASPKAPADDDLLRRN